MATEYDVWSDNDGRLKSEVARKLFVDDMDAPYPFQKHEIRVTAKNGNDAIKQFRKAKNQ
ncbi:hypothetical protein MHM93_14605 [Pseudoalteromonas sp. MM17-2]|uniref:hypothetical protein n=1 Tax=Pseudoalteromonas sp. MM17-2 TaxID=2917753 RepID=UPI001EF44C2E|nr:hypothetical protein [Pseudoalteromonas sp. MM17-2]MCG7545409.1 hypothetical protein [Pseudoalteromonas sp. MM17-2]